ncbi:major histocompatibility complex class I-related gene protein-like isoform X2 [Astyanax mexicanus]|uniref:major histocompatibility complex class I-related gene protein-like isoform X2 n=1 Tax=Astyanax mexicanus TaxID=7994 RepID=UPI0020CAD294|nr:major histocompatibility complex class I-related gene protein-like isoform X2 [Astyanax mexicanus]
MELQCLTLCLLFCSAATAEKYVLSTMYTVTQVSCQPKFTAVTVVNEQQITRFDSEHNMLIPTQDWVKEALKDYHWNNYSQIHLSEFARLREELNATMKSLGHTDSVHTFQRRSGCEWDDKTSRVQGFDEYGYDGVDFISLDLDQMKYVPRTALAKATAERWNSDDNLLKFQRHYYNTDCSNWLKRIGRVHLKKTGNITFYQKKAFSPVVCHVTGFCPKAMKISWRKNGKDTTDNVSIGDILPDGEGTYIRDISIFSDELDVSKFTCVVGDSFKNLSRDSLNKPGNSFNTGPNVAVISSTVILFTLGFSIITVVGFFYFRRRRPDHSRTDEEMPHVEIPLRQQVQDCKA